MKQFRYPFLDLTCSVFLGLESEIHYNNLILHIVLKVSESSYKISLYSENVYNKVF